MKKLAGLAGPRCRSTPSEREYPCLSTLISGMRTGDGRAASHFNDMGS